MSFNGCFRTRSKLLSNSIIHLLHARGLKSPDIGGPRGLKSPDIGGPRGPGVAKKAVIANLFRGRWQRSSG